MTVAVVLAILALLITPLSIISASVIALVVLRQGLYEGLIVSAMGLLAMGLLGALLFGLPLVLIGMALTLWLPLLILAAVLRQGRSLGVALEISAVLAICLVIAQYLILGEPGEFWAEQLGELFGQVIDSDLMPEQDAERLIALMANWMTGGLALAWFFQVSLSLFIARAWQAVLYNPGGFAREFQDISTGKWLLLLVPFLLVAGLVGDDEPNAFAQMLLVCGGVFFIQGIALVHGLVARLNLAKSWLIGFYFVLFMAMPQSFTFVSAAGYADGWLRFRQRLGVPSAKPPADDETKDDK